MAGGQSRSFATSGAELTHSLVVKWVEFGAGPMRRILPIFIITAMPKYKTVLKARQLKKAEVKDYIVNHGAIPHEEYTDFFLEDFGTGYTKQNIVYELPNGDFIYVFDPNGLVKPGKGYYYEQDHFLRFLRWNQKVKYDHKCDRGSSIDHWRFYSKLGKQLVIKSAENLDTIKNELELDQVQLDFSYKSLEIIDTAIKNLPYGKAWETLYDALVFYVGEVLIKRIVGKWAIADNGAYPYVTVDKSNLHYMPINIVWQEIDGINPCNLRKATADEVRTNAIWHPKNSEGDFEYNFNK